MALEPKQGPVLRSFALGSCLNEEGDLSVLRQVQAQKPDLLVMMGDNVYADATSPAALEKAYGTLRRSADFQAMAKTVPVLAVWDDHDYGVNDMGKENPLRAESKTAMLDFFGVPKDSPRRHREGNYDVVMLGSPGYEVQFILLDTRWFRDSLARATDPGATLLGPEQWRWLADVLQQPAKLRFIVSSIQFIPAAHRFEKWHNFPHERDRLAQLLVQTQAEGVVFLSGDRHEAELSCAMLPGVGYPVFEFTASSFNRPLGFGTDENPWRVRGVAAIPTANFGAIAIDWERTALTFTSLDPTGGVHWRYEAPFPTPGAGAPPEPCLDLNDHRP